jgi:hypothetical protein
MTFGISISASDLFIFSPSTKFWLKC